MIEKSNTAQLIRPSGTPPAQPLIGEIEHGVVIPRRKSGGSGELIAQLKRMAVGDSFATSMHRNSVYEGARAAGATVTVRAIGPGRIRVWRTA